MICLVHRAWTRRPLLSNPKTPLQRSSTHRLFQMGTFGSMASLTLIRDKRNSATIYQRNNKRLGSNQVDKLLYPTSPTAQDRWGSTGQHLTQGFQDSRPCPQPPNLSTMTEGLLLSLTQGLRKRLNMQRIKITVDFFFHSFREVYSAPALPKALI